MAKHPPKTNWSPIVLAAVALMGSGIAEWRLWRGLVLAKKFGYSQITALHDVLFIVAVLIIAVMAMQVGHAFAAVGRRGTAATAMAAAVFTILPVILIFQFSPRYLGVLYGQLMMPQSIILGIIYSIAVTFLTRWLAPNSGAGLERYTAIAGIVSSSMCFCLLFFRLFHVY